MTKYNIYKIEKTKEHSLIEKLQSVGLNKIHEEEINNFRLGFYFSNEPDKVDIWWVKKYQMFFEDIARSGP